MSAAQKVRSRTVLVLGADGFIGRHLAARFRALGWRVLAHARNPARLAAMGFETLAADLSRPECADPDFWRAKLGSVTHWVNAAGVLTAGKATYAAVHLEAPKAICEALPEGTHGLLLSAVGIDATDTDFARYRRAGEAVARDHGLTVLRAGLVLAETSYGGSSLARALAALPLAIPVVGDGKQMFNPIHAADLADAIAHFLAHAPGPGIHEIGGPETLDQTQMLAGLRRWLGLAPRPVLHLPVPLCDVMGRLGDLMRLGPISRTAVAQLQGGVHADAEKTLARLPAAPRGFTDFLAARPAGTQDLWHARLYLLRPALRLVLAFLWIASGLVGLLLPPEAFLPLVPGSPLDDSTLVALARFGGVLDLAIAAALLRGWKPRLMAWLQAVSVLGYTLAFTWLAPALWFEPLGGLLKNIPILGLIAVWAVLEEER